MFLLTNQPEIIIPETDVESASNSSTRKIGNLVTPEDSTKFLGSSDLPPER